MKTGVVGEWKRHVLPVVAAVAVTARRQGLPAVAVVRAVRQVVEEATVADTKADAANSTVGCCLALRQIRKPTGHRAVGFLFASDLLTSFPFTNLYRA